MGMLGPQPQSMFPNSFSKVASLADIEYSVCGLQNIDERKPFDRLRAFDFAQKV